MAQLKSFSFTVKAVEYDQLALKIELTCSDVCFRGKMQSDSKEKMEERQIGRPVRRPFQ